MPIKYEDVVAMWRDMRIDSGNKLAAVMSSKSISLAYNSGKIENDKITYYDTREVFEHDGVTSYTGDLRTLFEIRNAKDANEYIIGCFQDKAPIDEKLIKELQRILTKNTYDTRRYQLGERPGEYKLHDYVTGAEEVGALPEDVVEEMSELLAELGDISDDKALIAAAYFHAKFENIHPFADGNGRTGRLAMNYLLLVHNHPPVIIHEEDRKGYYKALEAWDKRQELEPLCSYLKDQTIKTWEKQLERRKSREPGELNNETEMYARDFSNN